MSSLLHESAKVSEAGEQKGREEVVEAEAESGEGQSSIRTSIARVELDTTCNDMIH